MHEESNHEKRERLRKQLDEFHEWPCAFVFKFIIPSSPESMNRLKAIFGTDASFKQRPSSKGNYVALTITEVVMDAEMVFIRYEEAGTIPGIISL